MIDSIDALIRLHEGEDDSAYQDSLGYWTIGVGHLIDRRKGGKLDKEVVELQFKLDKDKVLNLLNKDQPTLMLNLDPVRKAVLIDMCFNMGDEPFDHDGFKDWPHFLSALSLSQWGIAAGTMRGSLWAKQVKSRAERLAAMMETGKWPSGT